MEKTCLALTLLLCYSTTENVNYDGWQVIMVTTDNATGILDIDSVRSLYNCMIWGVSHNGGVSFAVSPKQKEIFAKYLVEKNLVWTITNDNIKASIDSEEDDVSNDTITFNKYNTLPVIKEYIESLNQDQDIAHSDTEIIGHTSEDRPLYLVRLSNPEGEKKCPCGKSVIVVSGGIHAREWISTACSLYLINELKTNPEVKDLLLFDWYIMPLVNPDGYVYTFDKNNGDRLWKKNRRQSNINNKCFGVDLNRNFDFMWNKAMPFNGGSRDPCNKYGYIGKKAFSEEESKAVKMVLRRKVKTAAYLSLSALGEYFAYSPAYKTDVISDWKKMNDVAKIAVNAMKQRFNTDYKVGARATLLGQSTGNSIDYVKEVLNITYAYEIELRDADEGTNGFLLPASEIIPTCSEMMDGIKALIEKISIDF